MHKLPKNILDWEKEEIPINENFYVISVYRQSVDKNLPGFDPSAMGPPIVWDEFDAPEYAGNWRDYQINAYGNCFYFYNNDDFLFQWDLFYPQGAHIHYTNRVPACGIVGDPIDWACDVLSDEKLLEKHFKDGNIYYEKMKHIPFTLEDLQSLKDYIKGLYRGIIVN
tara:strand:- start:42 stop:542 length:501 start_codon:yes stop_codon:yes gene_type:complete